MKLKKITAEYSESKLNTLALYENVDEEIQQIITTELDKLYERKVPKDVQKHLALIEEQQRKAKSNSRAKPQTTPAQSAPNIPEPARNLGGSPPNSGTGNNAPNSRN